MGVCGTEMLGQTRSPEEASGDGCLMSQGKKWRRKWALFLGENSRRQYNKLCKGYVYSCKQSFWAVVLSCPHYLFLQLLKVRELGFKMGKETACNGFSV